MAVEKLYESESYIVVNKPHDMYINSDDPNEKNTVAHHIGSHDSHLSTSSIPLHFVHRLDFSTSGVLCLAKTRTAAAEVGRLLEKRSAKKYYIAIVRNHAKFEMADVQYPVGEDLSPDNTHRMVAVTDSAMACGRPRPASTTLLVLATGHCDGEPVTYVIMKPHTGRRHQLRVHCHAIGHTILGDYTYSDRTDTRPDRMYLHAYRLVLPLKHEPLDISCMWKGASKDLDWIGDISMERLNAACETLDTNDLPRPIYVTHTHVPCQENDKKVIEHPV